LVKSQNHCIAWRRDQFAGIDPAQHVRFKAAQAISMIRAGAAPDHAAVGLAERIKNQPRPIGRGVVRLA
jgi:hypothetical protein